MPAPFVVAHLQVGLTMQDLDAPLAEDGDERAGVFLTNALTGWKPTVPLPLAIPELQEERERADGVKQDAPILVILGNPPYNGFAGVAVEEERELSEAYRYPHQVRRPEGQGLNDLYVRFFRMAERRIAEKTGRGVVCFISNYSWLDGLSFTGMRERYLEAAIAAVYARSLDNYFQSDDFDYLYTYGLRAAETGTARAVLALPDPAGVDPSDPFTWHYRPTTGLIVNILFRLFGVGALAGYHAALIAGHLAASALAGAIAARLTGRVWVGTATVAVFGLHFAHVETAARFGSIAEVVAGVLGLAAILAFLRFRESGGKRWAWVTVIAYGLALGANPTAAPVVGVFVLVDIWRYVRGSGRRAGYTARCWSSRGCTLRSRQPRSA